MLSTGSEGGEGSWPRELKVRRESSSILLFVLGGAVALAVTAIGLEAVRTRGEPSSRVPTAQVAPAAPAAPDGLGASKKAAKKARGGDAAAVGSRGHAKPPGKAKARSAGQGPQGPGLVEESPAPARGKKRKGTKASAGEGSPPVVPAPAPASPPAAPEEPRRLDFGPAESSEQGDRRALEEEMEGSLGGRAHVVWERGRDLVPRSVDFVGARPIAGPCLEAAGAVARAVLAAVGDEDVTVASQAPTDPSGAGPPGGAVSGRTLVPGAVVASRGASLVSFAAWVDGLPVEDGRVQVEVRPTDAGWVPVRLAGRLRPGLALEGTLAPSIEAAALANAPAVVRGGLRAEARVRPVACETTPGVARRAYEVTAPGGLGARREVVDGETGTVLAAFPVACAGQAEIDTWERDPRGKRAKRPLPGLDVRQGRRKAVTDADGKDSLSGTVELPVGFEARFLRVWPDGQAPFTYQGSADMSLLAGRGDEASIHQDEGAAFFYATTYNAWFQETFPESSAAAETRYALVVGTDMDNAFFTPEQIVSDDGDSFPGYVDLGVIDGRSAARDGSVVRHEYTHAILNGVATLVGTDEALGVNEGLADYFPCAFHEHPRVGEWLSPPYVRALDGRPHALLYPDDLDGDPHRTGNILNQALWDARSAAEKARAGGRLEVDQAVWAGVLRMPEAPSLADAAAAILAGDAAVNGGAHADELAAALAAHGLEGDGSGGGDAGSRGRGRSRAPAPGPDASPGQPDAGPRFSSPRKLSYVLHPGETLEVPIEATSEDGSRATLTVSTLRNAKLARKAGATASGTWRFTPDSSQRGRHAVTLTATDDAGETTRTLTVVVRQRRAL